jgi:hypothetical protein
LIYVLTFFFVIVFLNLYDRWLIRDEVRFLGWRKVWVFWSPSLEYRILRRYRVKYIDSFGNRSSKYCSVCFGSIQWVEKEKER